MTPTKQYFIDHIAETLAKALGLPLTVDLRDGRLLISASIEGPGAESAFWRAALEQSVVQNDS